MNFNKRGFILVEVFLAAAVMGIVLLAIFSTYNSGIGIWRSVKGLGLFEDRGFFISFEKMKRELMGYIRNFEDIKFEGNKEGVSFPALSGLEVVEVTYSFDKKRDAVMRKEIKFSESLKDKMEPKTTVLFDADDTEFQYLFYDDGEEAAGWISSFSSEEDGIPEAVKMDIRRDDEEITKIIFIPH